MNLKNTTIDSIRWYKNKYLLSYYISNTHLTITYFIKQKSYKNQN